MEIAINEKRKRRALIHGDPASSQGQIMLAAGLKASISSTASWDHNKCAKIIPKVQRIIIKNKNSACVI